MTIDQNINDEKLRYGINREAPKISALSTGKIDKNEYLTGKEILPSGQSQIMQQAKHTYLLLGKVFENKKKAIECQKKMLIHNLQSVDFKENNKKPSERERGILQNF